MFSFSAATIAGSAPSATISPSFCSATAWVSFIFRVRSFSAPSLRAASSARSLAGQARALCRELQAGGKARDVPPAQIAHGAAEASEHQAGAGARSTIAMPAMTAKAANKLPRTPKLKPADLILDLTGADMFPTAPTTLP